MQRKKKILRSRPELEKYWKNAWKEFPQEKLQRYVERLRGNLQWVIRLSGGNEYKEGTEPPPLPPGIEEPGVTTWREWLQKSRETKEEELGLTAEWIDQDEIDSLEDLLGSGNTITVV